MYMKDVLRTLLRGPAGADLHAMPVSCAPSLCTCTAGTTDDGGLQGRLTGVWRWR
jgi:hypothetical protein